MKESWLSAAAVLAAELAAAERTGDALCELDSRWSCEVIDRGCAGSVRLHTRFADEPAPTLRIGLDTMPETAARVLHEHFVQPVREAARRRRARAAMPQHAPTDPASGSAACTRRDAARTEPSSVRAV